MRNTLAKKYEYSFQRDFSLLLLAVANQPIRDFTYDRHMHALMHALRAQHVCARGNPFLRMRRPA